MLYDRLIGELVDGRYKIETRLGEGALSTVYAATHELIDKRVALKVLKQEFVADAEIVERFLREAKAASRLSHVNIISLSDFGKVPGGAPFFVMELLDGRTLSDLLYDGKALPVPEALRLVSEIGQGLAAAHQHGVVHRDLKPDNIGLVRDNEGVEHVKILDFGLAKITQENRKLTRAGQVLGTPEYMSPEQASGQAVDLRSDIFALGILLYRLIVGRVPFSGATFMEIISKLLSERPQAPRSLCDAPELTAALEAVILRAMARAPEDRFPTMDAMLEALRQATSGLVISVHAAEADNADSNVSTWVDAGPPADALPLLEDHATGPTALAPVVSDEEALGLGPTEAMDTVSEDGPRMSTTQVTTADPEVSAPSTERVAQAAAEVEEGLGNLWIEEHTAERLIRRAAAQRARRRVILVALIIGLVGVGAGAFLAAFLARRAGPGSTEAAGDTRGATPAMTGMPAVQDAIGDAVTPEPTPSAMRVKSQPRRVVRTVNLKLRSVPTGAAVYLDSKPVGRTPFSRSIALGSGPVTATVAKLGYRPQSQIFRPNKDVTFTFLLVRTRRARPIAPSPRPGMISGPMSKNPLGDLKDPFAPMQR